MSLANAFSFPNVANERTAGELEALLRQTGELEQRARLLGYYASLAHPTDLQVAKKVDHLRALIAARPSEAFLAIPLRSDEPLHWPVAKEWRMQVHHHWDSPVVLANAAMFLAHWNFEEADLLIRRAVALQPDAWRWRYQLGRLLVNAATSSLDRLSRTRVASKALAELKPALELAPESNHAVLHEVMCEAALLGGDESSALAHAQMALETSAVGDWSRGNVLHMAHTVLGCLAFDRGDLSEAMRHLDLSLAVPESPQFEMRGPSKHLLERMLSDGRSHIVVAYVNKWCQRFTLPDAWALDGLDLC